MCQFLKGVLVELPACEVVFAPVCRSGKFQHQQERLVCDPLAPRLGRGAQPGLVAWQRAGEDPQAKT